MQPSSPNPPVRWVASQADKKLCTACRRGDLNGAQRALEDGADPNCHLTMALGETIPLFLCASKGHQDIAELLIAFRARVDDILSFDHSTALHHACCANKPDMARFLLKQGCDPNRGTKLLRTPLMEAASLGVVELIRILLEHGADVNARDKELRTPLSYAVDNVNRSDPRWYESAKVLVAHGADVKVSGGFANGVTILHCAAAAGDLKFVQELVGERAADVFARDEVGKTPYDYAVAMEQTQVSDFLRQEMQRQNACCCLVM